MTDARPRRTPAVALPFTRLTLAFRGDTVLGNVLERLAAAQRRPPPRRGGRRRPRPHLRPGRQAGAALGGRCRRRRAARRSGRDRHPQRLRDAAAVPGGQPGRRHPRAGQPAADQVRVRPRRAEQRGEARSPGRHRGRRPRPAGRPRFAVDPGDVAALFYTSGTTGKPKGVELVAPVPRRFDRPRRRRPAGAHRTVRGGHRPARRPHHGLRRAARPGLRRRPRLPAAPLPPGARARRHRVAAGPDVHRRARHVPDAARGGRRGPRSHVGPHVGVGRRRHAPGPGRPLQEARRDGDPAAPRADRRGRLLRGLRDGRAGRRRGGQVQPAVPRRRPRQ